MVQVCLGCRKSFEIGSYSGSTSALQNEYKKKLGLEHAVSFSTEYLSKNWETTLLLKSYISLIYSIQCFIRKLIIQSIKRAQVLTRE